MQTCNFDKKRFIPKVFLNIYLQKLVELQN